MTYPRTRADRCALAFIIALGALLIWFWAYRVLPYRPGPVIGQPPATGTARAKVETP